MTPDEFSTGQHRSVRHPACTPSDISDDQQRVLPSARRLGECIQSAFISGMVVPGADCFAGGRYLSASTKPDSLMPSLTAFLMTRYVIQIASTVSAIDIANMNMLARAISASMSCRFIRSSSVVLS